jgi:transitional endoplasmic reticulum ATPase
VLYAQFWRRKLLGKDAHNEKDEVHPISHLPSDNFQVEFPEKMCPAVAEITDGFSFAYIQEAFVAALLAIAERREEAVEENMKAGFVIVEKSTESLEDTQTGIIPFIDTGHDDLEGLILWEELQKQIKILRDQLDDIEYDYS